MTDATMTLRTLVLGTARRLLSGSQPGWKLTHFYGG